MTKMTTFNVAAALAGALAVTMLGAATTPVSAQGLIKCYGMLRHFAEGSEQLRQCRQDAQLRRTGDD